MLTRLGHTIVRRRRLVLICALIATAAAGAIGGGVASHLSSGGFQDPSAESTTAANLLEPVPRRRPQPGAARDRQGGQWK